MTAENSQITRRVVIGGQPYDKPWDPHCPACRSPWLAQIDAMLAEGYSLTRVRKHLAGLRPAPPNAEVLRTHIPHLADPHRQARLAYEDAAQARGDDTTSTSAKMTDALQAVIRVGSQRLAAGELDIGARDMLSAVKIQVQLDRAQAGEGVESSAWQAAFLEFFELVQKRLTPGQWQEFVADVYDSPAIRSVLAGQAPAIPGGAP